MALAAVDPQQRLQEVFAELSPELQRAARWVSGHPVEVGLWSMRRQAQALSLAPATMLRLARAAGYRSYDGFRAAFQEALAGQSSSLRQRAARLQGAGADRSTLSAHEALERLQRSAVESAGSLNSGAQYDAAAQSMLRARLVGFLGCRSSFGAAFQMRYAHQLVQRNGVLLDAVGGTLDEQADMLGSSDVLVAITQKPYSAPTVRVARDAARRGVKVIALTDDALSPLGVAASHVLLFQSEPRSSDILHHGAGSFFHTMVGPLALAEQLIARVAAQGGQAVLDRLGEVEQRLDDGVAYWNARG